jgi:hypothetical protein
MHAGTPRTQDNNEREEREQNAVIDVARTRWIEYIVRRNPHEDA